MRLLQRRWLRTIPPYFATLLLAWVAVWFARRTPFDPLYLVFLQNYRVEMPFFLISWSLCVEEHFYLIVPLAMSLTRRARAVRPLLLAIGIIVPFVFRIAYAPLATGPDWVFGFHLTATHIHFEGLAIGMALAWLNIYRPAAWGRASKAAMWLAVPLAIGTMALALLPKQPRFILVGTAVAITFAAILLALAGRRAIVPRLLSPPVRWIAVTSYSVYLTHAMVLHAMTQVRTRALFVPDWAMLLLSIGTVGAVGFVFYWVIERGALAARDRFAPSLFGGGALAQQGAPASVAPLAAKFDTADVADR